MNNIKIYYFSPYDILRIQTNQVGDVRLCEGFAENHCDINLIVPYVFREDNLDKEKILKYYQVTTPFKIKYLKTFFRNNTIGKLKSSLISILNISEYFNIILKSKEEAFIISRSETLLYPLIRINRILKKKRIKIISWAHEVKRGKISEYVYKNADAVIGTNSAITEDINKLFNIDESKLAVSMNPITETQIRETVSKAEARKKISYNSTQPLVVYTGKLFVGQKEAENILKAAKFLPDINFLLTGGKPAVIAYYKKLCVENNLNNCIFTGYIYDYSYIRYYQAAADILVSYYSISDHLVRYNLPNKICEYMLTQNPIITPKFEALRDTLNEENVFFVKEDSPKELANKIKFIIDNPEISRQKAACAFNDVKQITFKKRTNILIEFLRKIR